MDQRIRFSTIKIVLKEGTTISSNQPGCLVLTDRYVFLQRDAAKGPNFQCEIVPWELIFHIGYDVEHL